MYYAPALKLFLKRPHAGGTGSKKLPQKRKERGSPRQPQTKTLDARYPLLLWHPLNPYLRCYAPALRLFWKRPMVGTPIGQEITPEEEGERIAPSPTDVSARCPLFHLTVARLGLASKLLSFTSEPLSGRGVEAGLLGIPAAMIRL